MIFRLAWKEYREGRTIWLALALLGAGAVFLLPVFLDVLGQPNPTQQREAVRLALLVLSVTYGIVAGSMLLAGEREGQTLTFLDVLTASREQLWRGKLLVGVVLALSQGLVLASVFRLGAPEDWSRGGQDGVFWLLPALTLEALAWGLLSSAFSATVLAGAGSGAALEALSWLLVAAYATASGRRSVYLPARVLVDGLALFASYSIFRHRSSVRAAGLVPAVLTAGLVKSPAARPAGTSPAARWRLLSPALWWLVWRHGRGEVVVAGTCLFVLGIGFTSHVSMLWPLATLLVGVVFGTSVWAREQADASYRFLTNQRLPPGRVWLVKTAFAAGASLAAVALGLVGAMIHLWLAHSRQPDAFKPVLASLRRDAILFRGNSPVVALVWLAHGFAAGQLLGMVCRKNLVAVMMTLPVSLMLVGVWLPSLIDGGLPAWQLYVVPALVLAACRLLLWPWATDNLATRRPLLILTVCGGAAAVLVACCLAYRVLGVPDVGEPFDVQAFADRTRDRTRLDEGLRVRHALAEFTSHLYRDRETGPPPKRPVLDSLSEKDREAILRQGWQATPETMHKGLGDLFKGDWFDHLAAAVGSSSSILFDLRQAPGRPALAEVCESRVPLVLALHALQLLEQGKAAESLRCLRVLLELSRVMRNAALPVLYRAGESAERLALRALKRWMHGTPVFGWVRYWLREPPSPELLRRALAELDRHEAELPPPREALEADYLGASRRLAEIYQELSKEETTEEAAVWYGQLFTLAQLTPWERVRFERLINLAYADALAGRPSNRRRRNWQGALVSPLWPSVRAGAESGLWRLRLAHLRVALILFRYEKGRSAASLAELVPQYLRAVPVDPFTGAAFAYRVESSKQRLSGFSSDGRIVDIEVQPGQGVLSSPGPPSSRRGRRTAEPLYFAGPPPE